MPVACFIVLQAVKLLPMDFMISMYCSRHYICILDLLRLGELVQQDKPRTPTSQGCEHLSVMTPHCHLDFLNLDFLDFLRLQLFWSFSWFFDFQWMGTIWLVTNMQHREISSWIITPT